MKKVLVMAAALSLLAAPALASSVVNSKHNLATSGPGSVKSNNYTEVCVFCHTPHGASTSVTLAPLWNRTVMGSNFNTTQMYNSSTLETSSRPSQGSNVTELNNSDAKLCFSCHDGASLTDPLLNPANSANNLQPTWASSTMGTANLLESGVMLKNDHPVGISYIDAQTAEGATGLVAPVVVSGKNTVGGLQVSYGSDGERLWCSSCHDVHDDAFSPFLAKTNVASALCVTCHVK